MSELGRSGTETSPFPNLSPTPQRCEHRSKSLLSATVLLENLTRIDVKSKGHEKHTWHSYMTVSKIILCLGCQPSFSPCCSRLWRTSSDEKYGNRIHRTKEQLRK